MAIPVGTVSEELRMMRTHDDIDGDAHDAPVRCVPTTGKP